MTDRYARALSWIERNEHQGIAIVARALAATAREPDEEDVDAMRDELMAPFDPEKAVRL